MLPGFCTSANRADRHEIQPPRHAAASVAVHGYRMQLSLLQLAAVGETMQARALRAVQAVALLGRRWPPYRLVTGQDEGE